MEFPVCRLTINEPVLLKNVANISGSALYGGLLDRCAISRFTEKEMAQFLINGLDLILSFSTVTITNYNNVLSISSQPVQVYLCSGAYHIEVKKGEAFK